MPTDKIIEILSKTKPGEFAVGSPYSTWLLITERLSEILDLPDLKYQCGVLTPEQEQQKQAEWEKERAEMEIAEKETEFLKNGIWSMDLVDQSAIPFPKAKKLIYEPYGEKGVEIALDDLTWRGLMLAADKAIKLSNDRHHIYIEDYEDHGDYLELVTGS